MILLLIIKIEGVCQFSRWITPQWNTQTSSEASLAPAKSRDKVLAEESSWDLLVSLDPSSVSVGGVGGDADNIRSVAGQLGLDVGELLHHLRTLPVSVVEHDNQVSELISIFNSILFHIFRELSTHLPLYWDILKLFSVPFSIPLISSTGAKPYEKILIRNNSSKEEFYFFYVL